MPLLKSFRVIACAALMLSVGVAQAATQIVDPVTGRLTGATGVNVGGAFYDVTFVDGSCVSLFSGCTTASNFTFQSGAQALAASQALLDQVFIDTNQGVFDTNPGLTQGLVGAGPGGLPNGNVYTPYGLSHFFMDPPGVLRVDVAQARNHISESFDQAFLSPTLIFPNQSTETGGAPFYNVYAIWTASPVAPPLTITQNHNIAEGQANFGSGVFLLNWANYFPAGTTWSAGLFSPTLQGDATDPSTGNSVIALSGSQVNLGNWIDGNGFNPNGVGINIPANAAAPELALNGVENFTLTFASPVSKIGFAVSTGLGTQGGGVLLDQLGAVLQLTTNTGEVGTLTLVDPGNGYSAWVTITANAPFQSLTFSEPSGNGANQYFGNIVGATTVLDTTPPVLTLPSNIAVDATSPAGATVNYTVTVTDNYLAPPTVVCSPSSGATFQIGVSTVNCTGTDAAGNSTNGSFAVTVIGPETQLSNMISFVQGFDLAQGVTTSLNAKLRNALNAMNRGSTSSACNLLNAFINEVQAQSGKKLTIGQADQLIVDANQARAAQGCP